eukprot:364642-Chlamydomonas_euryale.AAC.6
MSHSGGPVPVRLAGAELSRVVTLHTHTPHDSHALACGHDPAQASVLPTSPIGWHAVAHMFVHWSVEVLCTWRGGAINTSYGCEVQHSTWSCSMS